MTLLSMCMNLMQEQIVEKVSWIAEELGMKGDGNDTTADRKDMGWRRRQIIKKHYGDR